MFGQRCPSETAISALSQHHQELLHRPQFAVGNRALGDFDNLGLARRSRAYVADRTVFANSTAFAYPQTTAERGSQHYFA